MRAVLRRCALCCVCVLCVSWGVVLRVPCRLRSVRCCAVLRWCACSVLFVWSALFVVPGAVVHYCVLCRVLWCALVWCWVWLPAVVLWWHDSVSVSLSGRVACLPVVGVVCCGGLLPCVVFCGAVLWCGAVLLRSAVFLRCCLCLLPLLLCPVVLCCLVVPCCWAVLRVVLCCVCLSFFQKPLQKGDKASPGSWDPPRSPADGGRLVGPWRGAPTPGRPVSTAKVPERQCWTRQKRWGCRTPP